MGQLVPKRFYNLIVWVQVAEHECIFSGRLIVQQVHRNFRVTTECDHIHVWSLCKYQLYTNHTSSSAFFFLKPNMQSSQEAENLFFTVSALPQMKCWKWHVVSMVRLITVVNADRKNVKVLSLQPLISLKDCKFDCGLELTARLQTHFTLCLNQFTLPDPVIKKALPPWCTLTY